MKSLLRIPLTYIGSVYYRILGSHFVWWNFANRRARRLWRKDPQILSEEQNNIVITLQKDGIAFSHVDKLFLPEFARELFSYAERRWQDPVVQEEVREHSRALQGITEKHGKKIFLVNLWEGDLFDAAHDKPMLDIEHLFTRFSISNAILDTVNCYLGMFSKFRAWRLEATIPMPTGTIARSSQRWHRDEEDRRLVKVFLYLNDVAAENGPFMYVRQSQEGARLSGIFPRVPPRGSLKMPPNEDRFIPQENIVVATGRAGTLIFCDTTGLHKGGFAEKNHRLMYTSVYTSSASPWPIRYRYPGSLDVSNLPTVARYATENNPNQQEPKYYR